MVSLFWEAVFSTNSIIPNDRSGCHYSLPQTSLIFRYTEETIHRTVRIAKETVVEVEGTVSADGRIESARVVGSCRSPAPNRRVMFSEYSTETTTTGAAGHVICSSCSGSPLVPHSQFSFFEVPSSLVPSSQFKFSTFPVHPFSVLRFLSPKCPRSPIPISLVSKLTHSKYPHFSSFVASFRIFSSQSSPLLYFQLPYSKLPFLVPSFPISPLKISLFSSSPKTFLLLVSKFPLS